MINETQLDLLAYWMKERHSVWLKKEANAPKPWTDDKIMQTYKFTNPFRENDKTTVWFRENIRNKMEDSPDLLLATIIFRWFNFIPTGEVLLSIDGVRTFIDWEKHRETFRSKMLDQEQKVSGAYIIKTPDGMRKVDGILWCVDQIKPFCREIQENCVRENSLEYLQNRLLPYPYIGPFMAYEIVTDMSQTNVLKNAPDRYTWANTGPGAKRGINRLRNQDINKTEKTALLVETMQSILPILEVKTGFKLEMRDVEHSLCEFDKYSRVYNNEGKTPKQKYNGV
jgi:hypothetical protein